MNLEKLQNWCLTNPHSIVVDIIMSLTGEEDTTTINLHALITNATDKEIALALFAINESANKKDTSWLKPTCEIIHWVFNELGEDITQAICDGEKRILYNNGKIEVV